MNWLKSIYVSAYISAAVSGLLWSVAMAVRQGPASPWLGTMLACAGPVGFFVSRYALPSPRTSRNLNVVLGAGVTGTLASVLLGGGVASWPVVVAATVGIAGTLLYVHWYSRFGAPGNDTLTVGNVLPALTLTENGRAVRS